MEVTIDTINISIQHDPIGSSFDVICGKTQTGKIIKHFFNGNFNGWAYNHYDRCMFINDNLEDLVVKIEQFLVDEINKMLINEKPVQHEEIICPSCNSTDMSIREYIRESTEDSVTVVMRICNNCDYTDDTEYSFMR